LRRLLMVLTMALVMAAMMLVMAMPAFAKTQTEDKEGSCGIVGQFPQGGQEAAFKDCGVENNPNYKKNKFPSGGGLEG
jgi:hypothetical protein